MSLLVNVFACNVFACNVFACNVFACNCNKKKKEEGNAITCVNPFFHWLSL